MDVDGWVRKSCMRIVFIFIFGHDDACDSAPSKEYLLRTVPYQTYRVICHQNTKYCTVPRTSQPLNIIILDYGTEALPHCICFDPLHPLAASVHRVRTAASRADWSSSTSRPFLPNHRLSPRPDCRPPPPRPTTHKQPRLQWYNHTAPCELRRSR